MVTPEIVTVAFGLSVALMSITRHAPRPSRIVVSVPRPAPFSVSHEEMATSRLIEKGAQGGPAITDSPRTSSAHAPCGQGSRWGVGG